MKNIKCERKLYFSFYCSECIGYYLYCNIKQNNEKPISYAFRNYYYYCYYAFLSSTTLIPREIPQIYITIIYSPIKLECQEANSLGKMQIYFGK